MSTKNCLVIFHPADQSQPQVVSPMKGDYFSKKEAQRIATTLVRDGAMKAVVVENVLEVHNPEPPRGQ
jgi:nitrogen regulatory protein PII-like uncharacterized protein